MLIKSAKPNTSILVRCHFRVSALFLFLPTAGHKPALTDAST
ncbi:hypothetical protein SLEP1_g24411 [Rubroshorea leprosula]|uniref:Uncharacterized protein n=1 Tax=Rubroshorea leprosula TaxID=152421 RepID=A0AAV5JQ57_9ROSI|nr:hypothetical protein SLEP1_g24411 [Rubroshorea leprosula]